MRTNQLPDPIETWVDVEETHTVDYDLNDFCLMEGNSASSVAVSVKNSLVTISNEVLGGTNSNVLSMDIIAPTSSTGSDLVTAKVTFSDGQVRRIHWRVSVVDMSKPSFYERA